MIRFSARLAILFLVGVVLIGGMTDAKPDERSNGLAEGPIEISFKQGAKKTKWGPSEAKLVRVWRFDSEKPEGPYHWLAKQYGPKGDRPLLLGIEGTRCSILIIDGVVRPLILVGSQDEVWKIEGLDDYCMRAGFIEPSRGKVTFALRLADAHSQLTLDFGRALKISYDERFHGP